MDESKEVKKPPAVESATIEECFEDIGLGEELVRKEPATERPPSKKSKVGSAVGFVYKFSRAQL